MITAIPTMLLPKVSEPIEEDRSRKEEPPRTKHDPACISDPLLALFARKGPKLHRRLLLHFVFTKECPQDEVADRSENTKRDWKGVFQEGASAGRPILTSDRIQLNNLSISGASSSQYKHIAIVKCRPVTLPPVRCRYATAIVVHNPLFTLRKRAMGFEE